MRSIVLYFVFWAIGILGIYYPIKLMLYEGNKVLLLNYQNPLIIYSPVLFCVLISFVIFLVPILINTGIIPFGYYGLDKYNRAKSEFIILSLSIPGWIFLFIAAFSMKGNVWIIVIFIGLLLFRLISSGRLYFRMNRK